VTALLRAEGLTRAFGSLIAVDGVDLEVEQGAVHSIIGPNGAGKTTLFNLLTGALAPTRGRILLRGEDLAGLPVHQVARRRLARSFQVTSIFPLLSVAENLRVPALRHLPRREVDRRVGAVLAEVELSEKAHVPAGTLSHGDQRHLDIGIALATNPELLLLDEPTAGMPPHETAGTVDLIKRLRDHHGYTTRWTS
jgi:branched-chain amino acid transport system ATP-binding protein